VIGVDSSVIVKWFKKGEKYEQEALRLRDDVLSTAVSLVMSEWVYFEVVRSLVKVAYPNDKIRQAYDTLREMAELDFIKVVSVSDLLEKAKELEIELKLYASDAISLACALVNSTTLLSEDKHLLQKTVKDFTERRGLKIKRLVDFYSAP
jgi:predicted nucleic acid-binding protein